MNAGLDDTEKTDELLSVEGIAERWGGCPQWVYSLARRDRWVAIVTTEGRLVYHLQEVTQLILADQRKGGK